MRVKGIAKGRTCTIAGCGAPVRCKDLCQLHYGHLKAQRRLKPCGCGCGELTSFTYKHGHHTRLFTPEEQARRGRMNNGDNLRDPPGATWYRKVHGRHEHRVVAEQMVGRALLSAEVVHHKNHDKRDNRPENLEVMSRAEHMEEHREDINAGRHNRQGLRSTAIPETNN